jgi:hypothetical protein
VFDFKVRWVKLTTKSIAKWSSVFPEELLAKYSGGLMEFRFGEDRVYRCGIEKISVSSYDAFIIEFSAEDGDEVSAPTCIRDCMNEGVDEVEFDKKNYDFCQEDNLKIRGKRPVNHICIFSIKDPDTEIFFFPAGVDPY